MMAPQPPPTKDSPFTPRLNDTGQDVVHISNVRTHMSPARRPDRTSFDSDGPGSLSRIGPRHNNDFEDFRKIKILPTMDEILAIERPEYMPKKNINEPHFLPPGPERLLDTQFRLLRYDNVESIRDVCYSAAQKAFLKSVYSGDIFNDAYLETPAGNRYHLYADVKIEDFIPHERKGLLARLSFMCPPSLKGPLMLKSNRLENNMMCAILIFDQKTNELSVVYCDVHLRQTTFSMRPKGTGSSRAAVQVSFHDDVKYDELQQLTRIAYRLSHNKKIFLAEFPQVLYAGFYNALSRMQQIKPEDVAFCDHIAPSRTSASPASLMDKTLFEAPAFTREQNFQYDLSPLTGNPTSKFATKSLIADHAQRMLSHIKDYTSLDEGQANALCNSLYRELAFTQGPPGTGKTYLGIALTRVLLASRAKTDLKPKPILVVCLTNHALDSFMEGLKDAGVDKLLRIGNGSKREWTNSINLKKQVRQHTYTSAEDRDRKALLSETKYAFGDLSSASNELSDHIDTGRPAWHQIAPILKKQFPHIYQQLVTSNDGPLAQGLTFQHWASGGDLANLQMFHEELSNRLLGTCKKKKNDDHTRFVDELLKEIMLDSKEQSLHAGSDGIWHLTFSARQVMLKQWINLIDNEACARNLTYLHLQYKDLLARHRSIVRKKEARILSSHNVIGITTTALAARWDLLRQVSPQILITEEAGEVTEAHSICSLLPSLDQAIFIGDPLQLRPVVKEQAMTLETTLGSNYRLDESLFERFMYPRDPAASVMPTSQLNTQRRMHPQIAEISNLTYPFLTNHHSTVDLIPPTGLASRMFWLDHRVLEQVSRDASNSIYNQHEVNIIQSFVQYLLRGSGYSLGEIAVLTPYAAQLSRLFQAFHGTIPVWLAEKDKETLIDNGALDLDVKKPQKKLNVAMEDMLRIATIDNFQGEEAKVVILSTVRSGNSIGFLKTANRINVACSRAKNGFYIVGNAETLSQSPLWKSIVGIFDRSGLRGPALFLRCDQHHDHCISASTPDDFDQFPPCSSICRAKLACGHSCQESCHGIELHDRIPCSQPCSTIFPCGHQCPKSCHGRCSACTEHVGNVELPCGHLGSRKCSGEISHCDQIVAVRELSCGLHKVAVKCGQENMELDCQESCNAVLVCGHLCPDTCSNCLNKGDHAICTHLCEKKQDCGHGCGSRCHHNMPCPPCEKPCQQACPHGRCQKLCSETCDLCTEKPFHDKDCDSQHEGICCLPAENPLHREVCSKLLPCGHSCPSLKIEQCPSRCFECDSGSPPQDIMVFNQECGHFIDITTMDSFDLHSIFRTTPDGQLSFDPSFAGKPPSKLACLACIISLIKRRLDETEKLSTFAEILDRLICKINSELLRMSNAIEQEEVRLRRSFQDFVEDINITALAAESNTRIMIHRSKPIEDVRRDVMKYRAEVVERIESSLTKFSASFPGSNKECTLLFQLHLNALEYRAVAVSLQDKLRIVNHLRQLKDSSRELERHATYLLRLVYTESMLSIAYCQSDVRNLKLESNPYLHAEIRLHQVRFRLWAGEAMRQLPILRQSSTIALPVTDTELLESLEVAGKTSEHYPLTNSEYLRSIPRFHRLLVDEIENSGKHITTSLTTAMSQAMTVDVPEIVSVGGRDIEARYGKHIHGHLILCAKRHPYSKATFPEHCPECGKWQESEKEVQERSKKHLNEDAFLSAMKTKMRR